LARYEDDLWYQAIIVDLHDNDENDHVTVLYDMYKETAKVDLKDIFPFGKYYYSFCTGYTSLDLNTT
jgi:hypothetical protein